MSRHPCEGCVYWSGHWCDYLSVEGHSRGCPPGKECTVRTDQRRDKSPPRPFEIKRKPKKKTEKKVEPVARKTKWDVAKAAQMLAAKEKTVNVAQTVGISVTALNAYRKRHPEQFQLPSAEAGGGGDPVPEPIAAPDLPPSPDEPAEPLDVLAIAREALEAADSVATEAARLVKIARALLAKTENKERAE